MAFTCQGGRGAGGREARSEESQGQRREGRKEGGRDLERGRSSCLCSAWQQRHAQCPHARVHMEGINIGGARSWLQMHRAAPALPPTPTSPQHRHPNAAQHL